MLVVDGGVPYLVGLGIQVDDTTVAMEGNWFDKEWIISRLPKNIPQDIVDKSFDGMRHYHVKNGPLEVWCQGDRGDD